MGIGVQRLLICQMEGTVVRRHEAAKGRGVEARAEVVEVGFGVAFFAGEFVGVDAAICSNLSSAGSGRHVD